MNINTAQDTTSGTRTRMVDAQTFNTIKDFLFSRAPSFEYSKQYVQITKIYGGNHVEVTYEDDGDLFSADVKLKGIGCCDINSQHPILREKGIQARNRVFELLTEERIRCDTSQSDMDTYLEDNYHDALVESMECVRDGEKELYTYGKILNVREGEICESYATILLREGLAWPTQDGEPISETDQLAYFAKLEAQ